MAISLDEVRRRILIALFSDDDLLETLVLKGGNALSIIHKVGSRASLDMDFSIANEFSDLDKTRKKVFAALKREFGSLGYVLFDEKFEPRPSKSSANQPNWWGGYSAEFKLVDRALYDELKDNLSALRNRAEELGPAHKRTYTIDISGHEFCEGKQQREIDDFIVYVYSLEMIAAEKLRAICQQMPAYQFGNKQPRARDFYDIQRIIAEHGIELNSDENRSTVAAIFAAKQVPLGFLAEIKNQKDFHALDWPAVEASISGPHEDFDFYFDFVVQIASELCEASRIK